jgi:hypothetical protein
MMILHHASNQTTIGMLHHSRGTAATAKIMIQPDTANPRRRRYRIDRDLVVGMAPLRHGIMTHPRNTNHRHNRWKVRGATPTTRSIPHTFHQCWTRRPILVAIGMARSKNSCGTTITLTLRPHSESHQRLINYQWITGTVPRSSYGTTTIETSNHCWIDHPVGMMLICRGTTTGTTIQSLTSNLNHCWIHHQW